MVGSQSPFRCALCRVNGHLQPIDASGQSCGFSSGPPCPACSELKNVDDKIHDTETILQKLLEQRNVLKNKLNWYNDRLTNRLPLEVVARIFGFTIKQLPFYQYKAGASFQHPPMWNSYGHTPWTLAMVCKTWKDIIWASPQLWTSVSINTAYIPTAYVTFVKEWLGRSGRLPIDLTLYEGCYNDPNYISKKASVLKGLFDIVNSSSPRWRSLTVSVCDQQLTYLSGDGSGRWKLENLHFEPFQGWRGEIRETSVFRPLIQPAPTKVSVFRVHFKSIGVVWDRVTHVDFFGCPPINCLAALSHAPQITHLTFVGINDNYGQVPAPLQPIVHEHLQFLKICASFESIGHLLDSLTLPSLHELYIPGHLSQAAALVARSACRITSLNVEEHFTSQHDPERDLLDLLVQLPSLTQLVLKKPHLSDTFFDRLGPYDVIEGDPEFLPELRSLEITQCAVSFQWQSVARMFEPDPEVPELQPRRALKSLKMTDLEVTSGGDYNYDSDSSDSSYGEHRRRRPEPLQIPQEVVRSLLKIEDSGVEMMITDDSYHDLLPWI
ncbi:hypothetical protein NLJ89_g3119 [Agrocybe chaxingu]|uniref:F-box domain-containing protein n=1 Tax=Agrocybe chaxingu TaxID=84603 RepID=A0A9W8K593_9AGAR|nr:hypothetical protein NLJ89_g3119 [Agrocybe chaxingu]